MWSRLTKINYTYERLKKNYLSIDYYFDGQLYISRKSFRDKAKIVDNMIG